jgi:hypothetical protein
MGAACGGASNQGQANAPQALPLSPEVAALSIRLRPGTNNETTASLYGELAAELAAAGFRLVAPNAPEADIEAELLVRLVEQQSMFVTMVNGVRQVTYDATAVLQVRSGSQVIEVLPARFESDMGAVPVGVGARLAAALTRSSKLNQHAANVQSQKRAKEESEALAAIRAAEQKEKETQDAARQSDEFAWIATRSLGCKIPATLSACDKVQQYLATYPNGIHAAEARSILEQAKPKLEKLQKDDAYWATTGWERCTEWPTRENCAGVEVYLTKYPTGIHAASAQSMLDAIGAEQ